MNKPEFTENGEKIYYFRNSKGEIIQSLLPDLSDIRQYEGISDFKRMK